MGKEFWKERGKEETKIGREEGKIVVKKEERRGEGKTGSEGKGRVVTKKGRGEGKRERDGRMEKEKRTMKRRLNEERKEEGRKRLGEK
jgi:hypothetical protein